MGRRAIAFDFDGTLVHSGEDKSIHIMYAAYAACHGTAYRQFLHPDDLEADIDRLVAAYRVHPGAPRFQQLAAIVNCFVTGDTAIVDAPDALGVGESLRSAYASVREAYDTLYSALNDVAAERQWRPFPAVPGTLAALAREFDLYVASGVPEDILQKDVDHHGFKRGWFVSIRGADPAGGSDKGEILAGLKAQAYDDVLFVGDSQKDLEYAQRAGVKFFRITANGDFPRLLDAVTPSFPNETELWHWSPQQLRFFRDKVRRLIERLLAGVPLTPLEVTDWLHAAEEESA